jgi:plastocyanin
MAAALLVAAGLMAGCDTKQRSSADTTSPDAEQVKIDNFTFSPASVTVKVGTTVTWVNHDDVPHTVTANDKAFGSKALDTDESFSHQFSAPGTYPYFCAVHPHMTGQVIVK